MERLRLLLGGDLDEFLEQLDTLSERGTEQHLRHHPLLDLITSLQELLQRHRVAAACLPAERVVDQLLLSRETKE